MRMSIVKRLAAKCLDFIALQCLSPTAGLVRLRRLTYLRPMKLWQLERSCREIIRENVAGAVVEFGVALGGSAIVLATAAKERRFVGFDLFGMIPAPGVDDGPDSHARFAKIASGLSVGIGGDTYYGYKDDLLNSVKGSMASAGVPVDGERVSLVAGLFENTLDRALPQQIALAHIDCDWFDPVSLCLENVYSVLSPGGIIVLDDYYDYSGCKKAADLFLKRADMLVVSSMGSLVLQRPFR